MDTSCCICRFDNPPESVETATVRCDVRKFAHESFVVWRCGKCRSIHSGQDVDLDHYYAGYPFHSDALDWRIRAICRNMLGRLTRAGFTREHSLLDYGCGGGALVKYLRLHGYEQVHGFDQYTSEFNDTAVLTQQFDYVLSQDVIEHVPDPSGLLDLFQNRIKPGGRILVGTPNAEAMDLKRPEYFVHALHQPFHLHLLSRQALIDLGTERGWSLQTYYPKEFINTLVPFVNLRFAHHYTQCFDDTMDAAFELRVDSWRLWSPQTLLYGFFGYFFSEGTGGMAVFEAPSQ